MMAFNRGLPEDLPVSSGKGDVGNLDHIARHVYILKMVSLSVSVLSVASTLVAYYWFVRMRRTFRHDLIMLLIQADMLRAVWFMMYPIIDSTVEEVNTQDNFCQISGFFIAVGIEASDFAVFMIALHAALYIFRSDQSGGDYGLYKYRKLVYAIVCLLPVVLASLAFIGGLPGFVNSGEYCYLPVQPDWYRRALSWVPRYVVFASIVIIYACIYIHVRLMIHSYGRNNLRRSVPVQGWDLVGQGKRRRPRAWSCPLVNGPEHARLNKMATLGLVPSLAGKHGSVHGNARPRQVSISTVSTMKLDNQLTVDVPTSAAPDPIRWRTPGFMEAMSTNHGHQRIPSSPDNLSPITRPADSRQAESTHAEWAHDPGIPQPAPVYRRPVSQLSTVSTSSVPTPRYFGSRARSKPPSLRARFLVKYVSNIFRLPVCKTTTKLDGVDLTRPPPSPVSSTSSYIAPLSPVAVGENVGMRKKRDKIRRQLRLLFVYPLVYLAFWLVPFISHVLEYDDEIAVNEPFVMLVLSTVSMTIQGAVNCWLFMYREKPWRHTRCGFWEGLELHFFRFSWYSRVGRTHEEMLVDGRNARLRRAGEAQQERLRRAGLAPRERTSRMRAKTTREWWDVDLNGDWYSEEEEEEEDDDEVFRRLSHSVSDSAVALRSYY